MSPAEICIMASDRLCAINSYTVVRPPGFEVPSRCLDGFPGRWVGSPLDAVRSYVLDQARLRPLTHAFSPWSFLPYDWQRTLTRRGCASCKTWHGAKFETSLN